MVRGHTHDPSGIAIIGKNVKHKLHFGEEEGRLGRKCSYDPLCHLLCLEVFKNFILTSTSDIMIFKRMWRQTY
jgi:hypothetical protein